MKARKKLSRAQRQYTLAKIARREALSALASAVAEERQSAVVSERSAELLRHYSAGRHGDLGSELQDHRTFISALQGVANQASEAHKDAADQVTWQSQALAKADNKASRYEDRLKSAKREVEAQQERGMAGTPASKPSALARKLQNR